ncbi:hypothetical protein D3C80_1392730 [compost metagenome]
MFRSINGVFLKLAMIVDSAGAFHQGQNIAHTGADCLDTYLAAFDRSQKLGAAVAGRARHFQIQPRIHGGCGRTRAEPVRHHHAVKTPVTAQNLVQQPVAFRRVSTV